MNDPTPEEVRDSIVPKSDQLNADDLLTGPITVTIQKVRRGDKDQPVVVEITGHRPYKPCKTMRRVLVATFSADPKAWIGQQMTLYCDPNVIFGGVKVGGIRISHLTGLTHPRTFMLTQGRGKRSEVTIYPLSTPTVPKPPAATPPRPSGPVKPKVIADDTLQTLPVLEREGYFAKWIAFCQATQPAALPKIRAKIAAMILDETVCNRLYRLIGGNKGDAQPATEPKREQEPQNRAAPEPAAVSPPPADIRQWKHSIDLLDSTEACIEWRSTILPDCPESIRAAVERLLVEKETALVTETTQ